MLKGFSLKPRISTLEGVPLLIIQTILIIIMFVLHGIFLERIVNSLHESSNGETPTDLMVPLLIYASGNIVIGLFCYYLVPSDEMKICMANFVEYTPAAFTFSLANILSFCSLEYVNYPTNVLFKSAKPVSVMLFTNWINRTKYSFRSKLCMGFLFCGISIFMLANGQKNDPTKCNNPLGSILLFFSLILDGLSGVFQVRLKSKNMFSSEIFMVFVNSYTALACIIPVMMISQIYDRLKEVSPSDLFLYCICGSFGQFGQFRNTKSFGPLVTAVISTLRKFITVFFSNMLFQHNLNVIHWLSSLLVFIATSVIMLAESADSG